MISNEGIAEQSRDGNVMARISESRFARGLAAGALVTSVGGGVAMEGSSAYAEETSDISSVSFGRFAVECAANPATPVTMQPNSAGEYLPVTPVADCYGVFEGVKDYTVSPMGNDTLDRSKPMDEILATEICAISPSDGMVILENSYNPHFVDITVKPGATAGEHHNTVTICNKEKGTSATFDLSVKVEPVIKAVVKKLSILRHGQHVIKVINKNDDYMAFTSFQSKSIPPHSSRRLLSPVKAKWGAKVGDQSAPAGAGKIVFKR